METKRFSLCNNEHCCKTFNYLDLLTVHTVVDGPDPRDHFANERNLLTWLRTGLTLALVGFMTLLDLQTKIFAPAKSLPWTDREDTLLVHIVSYMFIGLGISSILVAISVYFKNLNQIVNRNLVVSQGWGGYTMAFVIMFFVVFVMAAALT